MNFESYSEPHEYWDAIYPLLKDEEAKNSLFLGLCYRFKQNSSGCMYQGLAFSEGEPVSALMASQYRTVCNLLPAKIKDETTANGLLSDFLGKKVKITGIVGEKESASMFAKLLEGKGIKTSIQMSQGIYRCEEVQMPEVSENLVFRRASEKDISKLGDWAERFHEEAVPHDPGYDGQELVRQKNKEGMFYVVEKLGQLVSLVGWSRNIGSSSSVNFVYTPKELRGNGYASYGVAMLTQKLLDEGCRETNLYTDMSNPTSNKIYQNVGYNFVCHSTHFRVE